MPIRHVGEVLHTFLTSALSGCEGSASRPRRFILGWATGTVQ